MVPRTARLLPLAVAYGPDQVPPWDWTRGLRVWDSLVRTRDLWTATLVAYSRGELPYGPEVEEAYRQYISGLCFTDFFLEWRKVNILPVPESLEYPRLVRRHPLTRKEEEVPPALRPQPRLPLCRQPRLRRLGQVAVKALQQRIAHYSRDFAEACRATAEELGLLDPYGQGDTLKEWFTFVLEVRLYLRFLEAYKEFPQGWEGSLEEIASELGLAWKPLEAAPSSYWEPPLEGARRYYPLRQGGVDSDTLHRLAWELNRLDWFMRDGEAQGGRGRGIHKIGEYLFIRSAPRVLAHVDWGPSGTRGGSRIAWVGLRDWVLLEIAQLYLHSEELRLCPNPNCRAPFLPKRRNQQTCARPGCMKWLQRNRGRS